MFTIYQGDEALAIFPEPYDGLASLITASITGERLDLVSDETGEVLVTVDNKEIDYIADGIWEYFIDFNEE